MNNYSIGMTSTELSDNPHLEFKMVLQPMTPDEIFEANKAYNAYEWKRKIIQYKQRGAVFFKEISDTNEYDKYFVVYKADGINFFADFGYHSCLSGGGFCKVVLTSDNHVFTGTFNAPDGSRCRLANNPKARDFMRKSGLVFSNSI